jgi:hypothetical protein
MIAIHIYKMEMHYLILSNFQAYKVERDKEFPKRNISSSFQSVNYNFLFIQLLRNILSILRFSSCITVVFMHTVREINT